MDVTTTETVPGRRIIAVKGVAVGSTVRTKNIGKDIGAGLKSLVGGELKSYSDMLVEARAEALSRMEAQAVELEQQLSKRAEESKAVIDAAVQRQEQQVGHQQRKKMNLQLCLQQQEIKK